MTPTKAEQLAARTSPVHQPAHGWTDADADAARLALELECILTDRDTPMPLTSRWWESAHEALALHRQRIDDELRESECPPDPDAVDRALEAEALQDEAAAELRRLSAVEAERDALRAALTRVLDTHEREAKAYLTAHVASENFSRRSAKADEHAHLQAAVEASKAEKEARELLAAMKGTT